MTIIESGISFWSIGSVLVMLVTALDAVPLGEDELRDLVAYILSSGNADHAFFKTEEELEEERKREEAEREKEGEEEVSEDPQ